MIAVKPLHLLAGGVVLAAVVYVAYTRGSKAPEDSYFSDGAQGFGSNVGSAIVSGAVSFADGLFGGAVQETASVIGVPKTQRSKCEQAKLDGRTWDASFYCPASDFLSYVWN